MGGGGGGTFIQGDQGVLEEVTRELRLEHCDGASHGGGEERVLLAEAP